MKWFASINRNQINLLQTYWSCHTGSSGVDLGDTLSAIQQQKPDSMSGFLLNDGKAEGGIRSREAAGGSTQGGEAGQFPRPVARLKVGVFVERLKSRGWDSQPRNARRQTHAPLPAATPSTSSTLVAPAATFTQPAMRSGIIPSLSACSRSAIRSASAPITAFRVFDIGMIS